MNKTKKQAKKSIAGMEPQKPAAAGAEAAKGLTSKPLPAKAAPAQFESAKGPVVKPEPTNADACKIEPAKAAAPKPAPVKAAPPAPAPAPAPLKAAPPTPVASRAEPAKVEPAPSPTRAARRVSFGLVHPGAKQVFVAGSFNGWKAGPTPLLHKGDGHWTADVAVPPGRHEYLFVVDGQWVVDPNAKETVANPFGGKNAVLRAAD